MNYILLGDVIATAKVERCGENDLPVLSITKSDGIVLQSEKFKKRIASKDTADYKVVHRGQLVQGIHIDEANFGIQEVVDAGIVSPAYKIWNITSNMIVPRYLEIVLRSPRSIAYYASKFNGSIKRRERLSDKDFLDMRIPCPPIKMQIHSIETLDKVASLISHRKQQLTELDNLIKARFVEMFGDPVSNPMGWGTKRFDALCENLDSRRKPITASEREAGIYPYYGASGIVDYVADYLFDEDILLVSEDGANLLMRSTPIAFSVSGKVWVNNHAHVVRFEEMSMQKYIEVFFSMIDISEHITGSAQPKLNQAKLNAMMFPVPDNDRLEAFLSFVKQTDKSKAAVQKALDEAQTLFDSLMQQYFG